MTLVAIFALKDELRSNIVSSVSFAKKANMTIRMVSGDNIYTATYAAIKAGIITEQEAV